MSILLLFAAVLLVVGALPRWPYSRGWSYFSSGVLGALLLVLLVLALPGHL